MKTIKISFRGRLLLCLGLVGGVAALAVVTMPATAPAYTRYVGPPLPDGSRVTFLYPTSVSHFLISPADKMPQPYIVQDVQIAKPFGFVEAAMGRFPFWGRLSPTRDFNIGVLTTRIAPTKVTQDCRLARQEIRPGFIRDGSNYYIDSVVVQTVHSGLQFQFQYQYSASSKSASFLKHETAITQSFQVLPAGVAAPVP